MTRFIYLSDTHWGVSAPGYTMQQAQPDRLPELLTALEKWIAAHGPVDFVLHGGDMIDSTSTENIDYVTDAFQLSVPTYLCLGNHDLTRVDATKMWIDRAPQFFMGAVNFTLETPDCLLHIMPNQWGTKPYYWNDVQEPYFLPEQERTLKDGLARDPNKLHFLSTHSPFHGVPTEQTGLNELFHHPSQAFVEWGTSLLRAHCSLRCILGAHNHINTCIKQNGGHLVTSSSFVEVPFEFKCFDISDGRITMATHCLVDEVNLAARYDHGKAFVQGRVCDRTMA